MNFIYKWLFSIIGIIVGFLLMYYFQAGSSFSLLYFLGLPVAGFAIGLNIDKIVHSVGWQHGKRSIFLTIGLSVVGLLIVMTEKGDIKWASFFREHYFYMRFVFYTLGIVAVTAVMTYSGKSSGK